MSRSPGSLRLLLVDTAGALASQHEALVTREQLGFAGHAGTRHSNAANFFAKRRFYRGAPVGSQSFSSVRARDRSPLR